MNTSHYEATQQAQNIVKNMLTPQRNAWLRECFTATVARMGQKWAQKDDSVLEYALKDFAQDLVPQIEWMSQGEIESILRLGANGELGDNIAMSSRTLSTWVRNYLNDYRPKVAKAFMDQKSKEKLLLPEPRPKELSKEDAVNHLQEVYDDFHENRMVYARSYDIAVRFEILPEKHRDIEKHIFRAKTLVAEDQSKQLGKGVITRTDFISAITDSEDGTLLNQKCRVLALCEWFDFMKLGKGFGV